MRRDMVRLLRRKRREVVTAAMRCDAGHQMCSTLPIFVTLDHEALDGPNIWYFVFVDDDCPRLTFCS